MIEKFLVGNKVLHALVKLIIKYNLFANCNKFKAGDVVKYNWKAYVRHKLKNYIEMVDKVYGGTHFADAFWLRKLYFWEK